jgi:hypothetical protein
VAQTGIGYRPSLGFGCGIASKEHPGLYFDLFFS